MPKSESLPSLFALLLFLKSNGSNSLSSFFKKSEIEIRSLEKKNEFPTLNLPLQKVLYYSTVCTYSTIPSPDAGIYLAVTDSPTPLRFNITNLATIGRRDRLSVWFGGVSALFFLQKYQLLPKIL